MYMILIPMLFTLLFARMLSSCDSRSYKGKYIIIKNKTLAKLLIDKDDFWIRRRVLKQDRQKLSVAALLFYFCNAFIIVLSFVFLFIPSIPCKPFEFDARRLYLYADTLNVKLPAILVMLLFCAENLYCAVKMFFCIKEIEQKWIKVLTCLVSIVLGIGCCAIGVTIFFELFK